MTEERRRGYRIEIQSPKKSTASKQEVASDTRALAEESDEKEVLLIDGEVVPYEKTSEGFRIFYQPPATDLLKAARSFVDTQRGKSE